MTTIEDGGELDTPKSPRDQAGLVPATEIDIQIRNGHLEIESVAIITVKKHGRSL